MKKVFIILFVLIAVATSLSAQNSDNKVSPVGESATVKDVKAPSSSLSTVLGGRVAGLISNQSKTCTFIIGGPNCPICNSSSHSNRSALVLIDGVEGELNSLNPEDIQSFTILNDSTSKAPYGARGANGVVIVTTKSGRNNLTKQADTFNIEIETDTVNNETEDFFPDLKIYPNQFSGTVNLAGAEGSILQVISIDGVVVHTQKITKLDETIKLNHLLNGIYSFCVSNGKHTKIIKGIKSK